jgi:type II restriction enzyme
MTFSIELSKQIEDVLRTSLSNKLSKYKPETSHMPFHTRLLGKDRLALYSFIHSLNTNFGSSIFEPVGFTLAQLNFKSVHRQAIAGKEISSEAHNMIQNIIDELTISNSNPNKQSEVEKIRSVCQQGDMSPVNLTRVDLMIESYENEFYLIDIKTAKPNAGNFKEFKRTLLEWVAAFLAENPNAKINSLIAIPYNPYAPQPYCRWTIRGMLDLEKELKVAEELWDFLGGDDTYQDLLDCFERVGIELRDEIDSYFRNFNKK